MEKLYCYKMSHDDGFAPNPYHGVLTLATCKPQLRQKSEVGNWIAGWTSRSMKAHSTPVGQERLVFLAKVAEKLSFDEYWNRYPNKRPGNGPGTLTGDNIYCPDISELEGYRIVPNYVINKYVKDKDILKLVKKLKRNNPLDYHKDFSFKRKYYIIGALINHIRKFRKYYE